MIKKASKIFLYWHNVQYGYLSDKQTLRSMLQASKISMKKPSDSVKQTQIKIMNRILSAHTTNQQINNLSQYLVELRHYRLLSIQTLNLMQKWIADVWLNLSHFNKLSTSCLLVEQGRYQIFNHFYNNNQKLNSQQIFKTPLQKLIYRYNSCIVNRKIYKNKIINLSTFEKWKKQQYLISRIDKVDNTNNIEFANKEKKKIRSNLQIQVQALLVTLGYQFQRQVNINGFMIDFTVSNAKNNQGQNSTQKLKILQKNKCILQVMGSHHYTVQNKLFGKDILRALILQEQMPVAMVHVNDINPLKGIQNRMNYIKNVIQQAYQKQNIQKRYVSIHK